MSNVGMATATVRATRAIAWRHLYKWITIPANFLPTFIFPLVFFTSFAGGLSRVSDVPGFDYAAGYTSFIFVFSLLQTCVFGGMATGFTIAADFENGFARRLMLCTQSRLAILFGYMLSTAARAAIMCVIITGFAALVGLRMLGSPLELAGLYALALCMSFVGTLWSSGVMFRGRSSQVAPAMQIPLFVGIFLAPVYVPYDLLQGWIHSVATYNPITWIMTACREFLAGEPEHIGLAVICIIVMNVVLGVWAVTGLRRAERAG